MKKILLFGIAATMFLSACKKEDTVTPTPSEIDPNRSGYIVLEFDNRVGSLNLVLDSPFYTNAFGQSYSVSKFDYFVSNIVLKNEDGSTYTVPQDSSYFLIKESNSASQEITLRVPEGNYTAVTFTIGIDSLMNTKPNGERPSSLDVGGAAAGMYWVWNSGYIFLKMEGKYNDPTDTVVEMSPFTYHIGGFGGYTTPTINNIKTTTLNFGDENAEVRAAHGSEGPQVHMYVDAGKVLQGGTNIDFKDKSMVMFDVYSVNIANNYAGMFSVGHVHNHEH